MQPGNIYFHKDFVFSDGAQKDKYLVVIGASEKVLVVAKTTSKSHHYRLDFGCQSGNRYPAFYLPTGSCCFKLPTWVCLNEFYELDKTLLMGKLYSGEARGFGQIGKHTRDIQFCAKDCDDITMFQESIVNGSLVPP
ncbi:hypothetical protein LQD23_16330 [Chromobacterium violaceum]|uniref:hypothetical protein n=1 Tax=Chromobacterium violaceum TaxID=536 RepID=UPI001E59F048|nr:hypothetical protein [Chromobacterium violaceum]MCD0493849.1 hypothetical protein [Chromobacterium violaceum]